MNTCTRTGRLRRFGYTSDTGIGAGRYCGSTSTSSPRATCGASTDIGAWMIPSPAWQAAS